MVGDTGLEPVRPFGQRILVEDRGAAPLIKTAFFVSPLCLPKFHQSPFLNFYKYYNIFYRNCQYLAQVRRFKIVTKTNHVEVWAFASWDGWIRTSGMHGSGRWYWIMHQSKFLYYHSKPCALPLGYIPFSINIITYFYEKVKIFIFQLFQSYPILYFFLQDMFSISFNIISYFRIFVNL